MLKQAGVSDVGKENARRWLWQEGLSPDSRDYLKPKGNYVVSKGRKKQGFIE
jgi:hypothetical protein